jgi:type IV secretory pathway VirB2 component (pilin)
LVMVVTFLFIPAVAFAHSTAGADLPWDSAFTTLQTTLTGKTAQVISVIVIAATGLMLAFGEAGSASRKAIQIVFGISLAFGATTFITTVFSGINF